MRIKDVNILNGVEELFVLETSLFREAQVKTTAADTLTPCVIGSPAGMVLSI